MKQSAGSAAGDTPMANLARLDCWAQEFVFVIASWAESIFGDGSLAQLEYSFHHSHPDRGEIDAAVRRDRESRAHCSSSRLLRCARVVDEEAAIGSKGLGEYLIGLASDLSQPDRLVRQSSAFGWNPVHAFVAHTLRSGQMADTDARIRLEGGGGSGAGFQVFCGESLVLTAGGGGGGGFEGRFFDGSTDMSLGGGGGGGVQFRVIQGDIWQPQDLGPWISSGGGGGCGTATDSSGLLGVLCGQRPDDDASHVRRYSAMLNHTLLSCRRAGHEVRVVGGGGGGGGTAECCQGYQIGYGFSFQFAAGAREAEIRSFVDVGHEPEVAIEQQLKHDLLFGYLYNASKQCAGSFKNWCCVCDLAQLSIVRARDERLSWFVGVSCCEQGSGPQLPPSDSWAWSPKDDVTVFRPPALIAARCSIALLHGSPTLRPATQVRRALLAAHLYQDNRSVHLAAALLCIVAATIVALVRRRHRGPQISSPRTVMSYSCPGGGHLVVNQR